jgi:adenylate cyclase
VGNPSSSSKPPVKSIAQFLALWAIAPTIAILVMTLRMMGWLQPLEWMALDQFFRLRPKEPMDERVVIIGITENDLQSIDRYPLDDRTLASILTTIKKQNPRAIGLDLFRDFPVEPGNRELLSVFKTTPNLIGIEKRSGGSDRSTVNPAQVLKTLGQTSSNNIIIDGDGKLRRALLYWTTPDGSNTLESLALRLSLLYLQKEKITPEAANDSPNAPLKLGNAIFPIFEGNDGSYIHADAGGYQILLNYRGPSRTFRTYDLQSLAKLPPNALQDKVVLLGPTAESLKDFFYTPYSDNNLTSPEKTHGVEIQANLVSQILSAALNNRPQIKVWSDAPIAIGFGLSIPEWRENGWIFLWACAGSLLAWFVRSPRLAILCISLLEGSLFVLTYWAFTIGWWIPAFPPALAVALSAMTVTGLISSREQQDRKLMMNLFGRYVSPKIAETIWHDRQQLLEKGRIKGRKMPVTVLFTDIKDFSTISERTDPEELMEWLNEYMDAMTEVVVAHGAVIDKFIGDAIMALFGVPLERETQAQINQDAESAIECAIEMGNALEKLNQKFRTQGRPEVSMRVGIATGTAVTGSLGGKQRMDFTAIGDTVNIAARLESYDKTLDGGICRILISDTTQNCTEGLFPARSIGSVQLKGREQSTHVYQILSLQPIRPLCPVDRMDRDPREHKPS